jgi:hypothetical protein
MTSTREHPQPPDICLLLRAFAEQRWLTSELMPHLSDLERSHAIPEDQLGAALAYLEVLWLDAQSRAAETDAAFASLQPHISEHRHVLHERARRYYAAVRRLRRELDSRVRQLTQPHIVSDLRCARIQLRD